MRATKTDLRKTVIWVAKLDRPEPRGGLIPWLAPQRFSEAPGQEGKRYCIGWSIISQRLRSPLFPQTSAPTPEIYGGIDSGAAGSVK